MTANDISQLPPELSRAGRLDAIWYFSLPSEEERKEIFKIHLEKTNKKIKNNIINKAIKETQNYTGAEIEQIVKNTMRKAFVRYKQDNDSEIHEKDILESIKEVIPIYQSSKEIISSLEQWAKTRARYSNEDNSLKEYNSASDIDLENALKWDI